jgi:1,4-dihydroxy-2-naphthoate octaprenyltransferase
MESLVPLVGFFLQIGQVSFTEFAAHRSFSLIMIPNALIHFGRMMIMNLPDMEADKRVGKNTFVVKIGFYSSMRVMMILFFRCLFGTWILVAVETFFFGSHHCIRPIRSYGILYLLSIIPMSK